MCMGASITCILWNICNNKKHLILGFVQTDRQTAKKEKKKKDCPRAAEYFQFSFESSGEM